MWPERKHLRVFAARLWLVAALVVLVSGLILGANLALLGYAQPRSDPVGQLTPARLMQIERSLPQETSTTGTTRTATTVTTGTNSAPVTTSAIIQQPPPHDNHIAGEHSDD
ncbi:MAG: hypothetical protein ACYDHO_02090 [Gaiellaceae bacterium]